MIDLEAAARVCHEANRALQVALGEKPNPHWEDAEASLQASAVDGVAKAMGGLSPEELHESWVRYRLAEGWVYGPQLDRERQVHPCLVDYDELPAVQRLKDELFVAVVGALAGQG